MSLNIFAMKSILSWASRAQTLRKSFQPVQLCRFSSDVTRGQTEAEQNEDTTEMPHSDKTPYVKENASERGNERSLNEIKLLGRVGKDPTIFEGRRKPYIVFPLGTSSINWDSEIGQYKEVTEWHTIINYNPQKIENISRYLKKGDRVLVCGKLVYRMTPGSEKSPKIILQDFISMYG